MRKTAKRCVRLRGVLRSHRGMTMVSVLVAFVILLMMVALFLHVCVLSQNLLLKADSVRRSTADLMKSYYLNDQTMQQTQIADENTPFQLVNIKNAADVVEFRSSFYAYSDENVTLYTYGQHRSADKEGA